MVTPLGPQLCCEADQAGVSHNKADAALLCPIVRVRRNVPGVERAMTPNGNSRLVDPARKMSAGSVWGVVRPKNPATVSPLWAR